MRPDSLRHAQDSWIQEIRDHAPHVPCILVGTHIDLRDDPKSRGDRKTSVSGHAQCVSTKEGMMAASRIGADSYVECSSLTEAGISRLKEAAIDAVQNGTSSSDDGCQCACTIMWSPRPTRASGGINQSVPWMFRLVLHERKRCLHYTHNRVWSHWKSDVGNDQTDYFLIFFRRRGGSTITGLYSLWNWSVKWNSDSVFVWLLLFFSLSFFVHFVWSLLVSLHSVGKHSHVNTVDVYLKRKPFRCCMHSFM